MVCSRRRDALAARLGTGLPMRFPSHVKDFASLGVPLFNPWND
jgi:hypothetical protein